MSLALVGWPAASMVVYPRQVSMACMPMKRGLLLVVLGAVALAGCDGSQGTQAAPADAAGDATTAADAGSDASTGADGGIHLPPGADAGRDATSASDSGSDATSSSDTGADAPTGADAAPEGGADSGCPRCVLGSSKVGSCCVGP
jgi:hypothetical protein